MYVKQFCLKLLLSFICVAWADIGSTVDVAITSKVQDVSEDLFHLSRTCASDKDCHHLGKCVTGTGGKFCKCKSGTSGDFCEKIDECIDNPVKCGTLDDVSCIFDVQKEMAVCKCDNETKTYVQDEERCMIPCLNYYDCGPYGYCYHKIGNKKFCACALGTSGDYCEIIDECHNKVVDCGVDNNATCILSVKGNAYCTCDDTTKGFDYDKKICKDCSGCGGNDISTGKCSYRDGIRICSCRIRYYSNKVGKCEDCKCGQDSYGCKFENGTKICQCFSAAAEKDGFCQKCYCGWGPGTSKCEFKFGKKVCTCKDGYTEIDGTCKKMCSATTPCENGGKCVKNVCNCLKGTSGDFCETIDECKGREKCGSAVCAYNVSSQEAYCKCEGSLTFDDYYKMCRVCSCGSYTKSCKFVQGKKRCNCTDPYEDKLGTCTFCFCKGYSSMYGCKFDDYGNMKCRCLKGYAQVGDECKKCDCGDHGNCSLTSWGSKYCTCDEGYDVLNGMCKECDCGKNGKCFFAYDGKKRCSCSSGFKEYQGTCKSCTCESRATCDFDEFGNPKCTCPSGYGMKNGVCTYCDCYPGTDCTFDGNNFYKDKKVCICPKGYADSSGSCHECDCEAEGSNCTFSSGFRNCQCPKGYREEHELYSYFTKVCRKIDECKNSYACPSSTTKCINKPEGYECVCKDGYEGSSSPDDIKREGCTDINECLRDYKPCDDPSAICVNTPGSYRCECRSGYLLRTLLEKRNMCGSGIRPWRIGSIVVGVASAIIVIGLLIAIGKRYSS